MVVKRPDFKGNINILNTRPFRHIGQIALWKQFPNDKKHPILSGIIRMGNNQYQVAVWEVKSHE
jgi:hypothetical protein